MSDWYHSGIEGYCKAAAALAGMGGSGGWSAFGSDILPGRFDRADKATKTWTLSRFRRGSGNRLSVFEDEWLRPSIASDNAAARETAAIETCISRIIESADQGGETESPIAALMYRCPDYHFASRFSEVVLPAMATGFHTEGYHSSDIARFGQNMRDLIGNLRPGDAAAFRSFARTLVAALVYGPDHRLAASSQIEETIWYQGEGQRSWAPDYDNRIVVSQLFGSDAAYLGYSERFSEGDAIFFGRSANLTEYLKTCARKLSAVDETLAQELAGAEKMIFPVARAHRLVSNTHGLLIYQGQNWYFFDFSSNGTSIIRENDTSPIHYGGMAISPGDQICLGTSKQDDESRYQRAATVLVSFHVSEQT